MKRVVTSGKLATLLAVCLMTAIVLPAGMPVARAASGETPVTGYGAAGDVVTPLHAAISISKLAPVGQPVTVTCSVTADQDAPGTTAQIELPANARRASGELVWQGDLLAGETTSVAATVVFDAGGDTTLLCRTLRTIDNKNSWGDLAALYLSVGQDTTSEGFAPSAPEDRIHSGALRQAGDGQLLVGTTSQLPPADAPLIQPPAHEAIPPAELPQAPQAMALDSKPGAPQVPAPVAAVQPAALPQPSTAEQPAETPDGNLTVTGNWSYFDRNDVYTGAEEFLVELVRGDNYGHLAYCFTDLGGTYSCGPVTNPGGVGVRTIVHTWSNYNPNPDTLAVVNPDWGTTNAIANTFSAQTGVVVFADGTHDIGAWYVFNDDSYERAYWTQRDINDVWRYILFNGGGGVAGPTTVQWKLSSTDGTYYNPGGNVHMMGVDPLSPLGVVAKHEYGHNVMYNIYGNYMPPNPNCNPHTIQAALSAGCGWTEGWTEFLTSVVNNSPTFYWPSGASLDLEYPTWGTPGWDNGDWPEGRVAGALWDIYDSNNDGDDTYSDGTFVNLWDVSYNANDNVMADFWYHWLVRGHSTVSWGPIMDLYQNTINYRGGPLNDDFNNAQSIGSVPFYVTGLNTINATTQGNDPPTTCASTAYPRQSRSVWYTYTPPITGNYNINTIGSNHDTVLSVWTGAWGALASQGCDDDAGGNYTSSLNVTLNGGTTYRIEAMAYGAGAGGLLNLTMTLLPPPNDDFNNALPAAGTSYSNYENTTNATTAGDDPSFACGQYFNGQGAHSVWYSLTPDYNRMLTASTLTSSFDTVLGVWTGPRGGLTLQACNDDANTTLQSEVTTALHAGTTYHIEALSYNSGNYGALNFATSLGPICPDFAAPAGVGIEDVSLIANMWGQQQGPPYDYNGDGMISIFDLLQVTPVWGENCLAEANSPELPVDPALKRAVQ